jgi:predicted RNase H-like HicB family nuclease
MRVYSAVIERCPRTGLFVGFVPGFSGAHSQGETLDELNRNLQEVIAMLLEDGEPQLCGWCELGDGSACSFEATV